MDSRGRTTKVVILGILALIACYSVLYYLSRAVVGDGHGSHTVAKAMSELSELTGAIDQFRLDCDRYPTTQEGLNALIVQPKGATGWHGPYLKQAIPLDPWDHPYVYTTPSPSGSGYEVKSYGADGKPGGVGENADIVNGSDT